jgi:hypothetical protein
MSGTTGWASLTPAQQTSMQAYMDTFRPLIGQVARVFAAAQTMDAAWTGFIQPIVTAMGAGQPIETTTGLAGAQVLTTDMLSLAMADLEAALASYNALTNRQLYIAAAGLANTLG